MADDRAVFDTPMSSVFAVLADPPRYERFVLGNAGVRRFDPGWPEEGSEFAHTLGIRPLVMHDTTTSLATDHRTYLVLLTRMSLMGATITSFVLQPRESGTLMEIREEPMWGPVSWLWSKLVDQVLAWRNRRLLIRLSDVAEEQFARERSVLPPGSEAPAEQRPG